MSNEKLLGELEHDFLIELFNIGVGRAAGALSQIVQQEVILAVPNVEYISIAELTQRLKQSEPICSVSQAVKGSFEAKSMLLFPEQSSLSIVKSMLGNSYSNETLAELHQEGFTEIGNIVLNACIGSLGESINEQFQVNLPIFKSGCSETVLDGMSLKEVLFIKINLKLKDSQVEGNLVFLLGQISLKKLRDILHEMVQDLI